MSRFHGMRSLAVLLGSLVGAVCVSAGVGLTAHLTVIGLIIMIVVGPIAGGLVREQAPTARQKAAGPQRFWRNPTIVILSAVAFTSFLCEGSASD